MALRNERVHCDGPKCRKSVAYGSERHELDWEVRGGAYTTFDFCSERCMDARLTPAVLEQEGLDA